SQPRLSARSRDRIRRPGQPDPLESVKTHGRAQKQPHPAVPPPLEDYVAAPELPKRLTQQGACPRTALEAQQLADLQCGVAALLSDELAQRLVVEMKQRLAQLALGSIQDDHLVHRLG